MITAPLYLSFVNLLTFFYPGVFLLTGSRVDCEGAAYYCLKTNMAASERVLHRNPEKEKPFTGTPRDPEDRTRTHKIPTFRGKPYLLSCYGLVRICYLPQDQVSTKDHNFLFNAGAYAQRLRYRLACCEKESSRFFSSFVPSSRFVVFLLGGESLRLGSNLKRCLSFQTLFSRL
jgi:hypothetical protein